MIPQKDFAKLVENYVFRNEAKHAREIAKFAHEVPKVFKTSGLLYRGMIIDKDLLEAIRQGHELELKEPSSWSRDINVSTSFIRDPSMRLARQAPNTVGVLFRRKMNEKDIILNIQSFALFFGREDINFDETTYRMAIKEAETLVKAGIKLKRSDIYREVAI